MIRNKWTMNNETSKFLSRPTVLRLVAVFRRLSIVEPCFPRWPATVYMNFLILAVA